MVIFTHMAKFWISYPIKPKIINQKFGETANLAYYQQNGVPIVAHNGIDFGASHGQPVYAAHDGSAYLEVDEKQGHGVVIRTNEMFDKRDGTGLCYKKTIYWHLCDGSEPQFKSPILATDMNGAGQPVKEGDIIGYADNTGLSTGDHLHFGMKEQDKNESNGVWHNLNQGNGMMGAIDPTPDFNGMFACDIPAYNQAIQVTREALQLIQEVTETPEKKLSWLQIIKNLLLSLIK